MSKRGGKRKGAGRPKSKEPRVTLSCRVTPKTKRGLLAYANHTGISLGSIIDMMAGGFL